MDIVNQVLLSLLNYLEYTKDMYIQIMIYHSGSLFTIRKCNIGVKIM